jgi:prophage regulatory protein
VACHKAGKIMENIFKLRELCARIQLSKSTVYLEIQRGNFPPPIKLTQKTNAWLESDIDTWLKAKIDAARALAAEVAE